MDNHTHLDFPTRRAPGSASRGLPWTPPRRWASRAPCRWAATWSPPGSRSRPSTWTARLLGAVALHPNDAPGYAGRGELEDALAEIEALAAHPRIRAIGETGLDFFRTEGEGLAHQRYSFRRHIDIAKRLGPDAADP